ncbi:MAG TPA: TonB dependent receptor [Flavobacterium sp.]|nr:TonB dependent receptor [Flavobacterium sp.]
MKLKLLLLALLPFAAIQAQSNLAISGKVTDKSNQPISYATITVKDAGAVVGGSITDDKGDFEVKNLSPKNYTVEIQFIGYKAYQGSADLTSGKSLAMNRITLIEEATQLEGVEIVQERSTIEQKIDRKVINVGRDLTTAGATASEIMNNIPSVNVDQDGKISLRGNQNVRVLVDGRPTNVDPAQLLKQIPSTSIKKIELITNPSAKYNPEGMSGIINIVLHKNSSDGFNGSLNAGMTFAREPKFNNSLDMNYRRGQVNFFGNVGGNFGKYLNDGFIERFDNRSNQILDIVNDNNSYLYKIGMDYYIDDNNTLSFYTNQNGTDGTGNVNTDIRYLNGDQPNVLQIGEYLTDNNSGAYNLAFKHKFKKEGHTLDFEGNYNDYDQTQNANFDTTVFTALPSQVIYSDKIVDKRENTTLNLDYINPLTEKSTLELGAEARIIRTSNDYRTGNLQVDENARLSNYTYDIDIYSAYATFGQKFEKFSYQVGARFESYKAKANLNNGGKTFDDDYLTLYPSAYLTYNLNEKNTFQLSYSRRVDRPSLEQTKPIREFATPLVTGLGNQELQPQFTNSIELNYTRMFGKGSSFTGGVFYRIINDEINRVLYSDETTENPNDLILSWANFDNNRAYGFELSANYKITKWWDVQPAVDFSSISQKGLVSVLRAGTADVFDFVEREIEASAFNARLNSNFKANKRLSFLLFGFYRGGVNGIQNNSKEMYKMDMGGRYSLLDSKLTFSLRFNDVFNTMEFGFDGQNPYPSRGLFGWESQSAYLGINYMFGGGKNRALQRKQREDNTKQGGGLF